MPGLSATQITTFRARTYTCSSSAITGLLKNKAEKPSVSLLMMLLFELSSIDLEHEDSLLEESYEKDDRFNEFIWSINQAAFQCISLYSNYYDLM